jgi:SAM-dependent methyltransferase
MPFAKEIQTHSRDSYRAHVRDLLAAYSPDEAVSRAVGGNYTATGIMQEAMLKMLGLRSSGRIIDLGCGSGRYASRIGNWFSGDYLGIDVVPELIAYADEHTPENFRFEIVDDIIIPAGSASVDLVTAFSLFTHLFYEESFLYLREAARVLKPDGAIVFSFLEFAAPNHWVVFERRTEAWRNGSSLPHLDMFIERSAIETWVKRLGLRVERYLNGWDRCIPISETLVFDDGHIDQAYTFPGQSVAVLRKAELSLPKGFNARRYVRLHPDLIASGVDGAAHYLRCGFYEGRRWR